MIGLDAIRPPFFLTPHRLTSFDSSAEEQGAQYLLHHEHAIHEDEEVTLPVGQDPAAEEGGADEDDDGAQEDGDGDVEALRVHDHRLALEHENTQKETVGE